MIARELRPPLLLLIALLVIGTVGYRLVEGWTWLESAWMVVITVTTIGFGEVHRLSDAGRVFTLGLITMGVGTAGYALARLTNYAVDGGLARDLAMRRRRRAMEELRDHFVVVGFGRLGREVAHDLHAQGKPLVIIETDPDAVAGAARYGITIHGDGSSDAILREAGIERARGIAVATPHSPTNVFVTLSARQLNPGLYIIVRIDDVEAEQKARLAGADAIISPFTTGGTRMAQKLLHPHAADFLEQVVSREHSDLAAADIPVGPKMVGRLVEIQVRERYGVMVVAVRRPDGHLHVIPTELREGDIAIVVGSPDNLERFRSTSAAGLAKVR